MALTKEQFTALRSKGLSTEQIVRFESVKPKNVIGDAIKTTGDILSGGFKREIQAGTTSFNTITGGPATEFAHGVKTEAMTRAGVPELVAEAASTATDPQSIIGGLLAISEPAANYLSKQAVSKTSKAQDLFRKILPSSSKEQTQANLKGVELPEVEVGTPLVKKSKDYGQLQEQFSGAKSEAITKRTGELESSMQSEINDPVNRLTSSLQRRINNLKNSKRAEPAELSRLEKVLSQEQEALIADTERMTIDKAERIKEFYQKKAQDLYKKEQSGNLSGNESVKLKAYADLADDAKNLVDELANVSPTNRTIQGAGRAERLAAEQKTAFQQRRPQGFLMELVQALRGGPHSTGAAIIRGHFGKEIPLSKSTSQIQKLIEGASKSSEQAELLRGLLKSSPEQSTPRLGLPAPQERTPQQLQLPAGQGFEMLTPEQQATVLDEYRKRTMASLGTPQQLQISDYTGPERIIPVGRTGQPRDVRNVDKFTNNMSLRELLNRRKKNFK